MTNGPLSPDGRSQWNGTDWVPVPPSPRSKMRREDYARMLAWIVLTVIVLTILVVGFGGE